MSKTYQAATRRHSRGATLLAATCALALFALLGCEGRANQSSLTDPSLRNDVGAADVVASVDVAPSTDLGTSPDVLAADVPSSDDTAPAADVVQPMDVGPSGDSAVDAAADTGPLGPTVVSVAPADGAVVDTNKPTITITFDKGVSLTSAKEEGNIVWTNVDSGASIDFEVDWERDAPAPGGNVNTSALVLTLGPSLSLKFGGSYQCTVSGIRVAATDGAPMAEPFTWTFSIKENPCGDGVCAGGESECTCAADCGACGGCCEWKGGSSYTCHPGTTDTLCGQGGVSCGVCLSPDHCIGGQGCG